jgi:hypothetical protein
LAEYISDTYKDIKTPLFVMTDDGKNVRNDILKMVVQMRILKGSRATLEKGVKKHFGKKPKLKLVEREWEICLVAFRNPMLMLSKAEGHAMQALFFD